MRAVCYARFSPRPDAAESESNLAQLDLIRAYCSRQGWKVAGEHQDEALSGSEEERPGLWAAVDALRKGDRLVVYKLDRLARSVYLAYLIEQAVEKRGARIVSVTGEGTATDGPEDELVRRILQALAEYQRKVMAARTKAAMLRHQAAGRAMGGCAPLGKRKEGARLVDDGDEARAVERMRQLAGLGLGPRAIARRLQAEGFRCRGREWRHSAVVRALAR